MKSRQVGSLVTIVAVLGACAMLARGCRTAQVKPGDAQRLQLDQWIHADLHRGSTRQDVDAFLVRHQLQRFQQTLVGRDTLTAESGKYAEGWDNGLCLTFRFGQDHRLDCCNVTRTGPGSPTP